MFHTLSIIIVFIMTAAVLFGVLSYISYRESARKGSVINFSFDWRVCFRDRAGNQMPEELFFKVILSAISVSVVFFVFPWIFIERAVATASWQYMASFACFVLLSFVCVSRKAGFK